MSIVDLCIIIFLIFGFISGFKRGAISASVSLIGTVFIVIVSFFLKNPISAFMYKTLPFISLGGIFSGLSAINILIYEVVAYLICIIVLESLLKMIIKITGLLDKIVKMTFFLTLPSRLIGAVAGTLEYLLYSFAISFILIQIPATTVHIQDSNISNKLLYNTPILSTYSKDMSEAVKEIREIALKFDGKNNKNEGNKEVINVLLKYDIITKESVIELQNSGKLKGEIVNVEGEEKND